MTIRILQDPGALARAGASEFTRLAQEAIRNRGGFTVALSGGSTPRALYALLASEAEPFRGELAWDRIRFFWGDERHVPPDDPESNYRMAREALLSRVPVPESNVHRIRAENPDAGQAAAAYEEELTTAFQMKTGEQPRFDLVLLGMGPEGHTASLFPGSPVLREEQRLVAAPWVEKFRTYRITLTPPVLNRSATVVFLVGGEEKAETLRAVLEGPRQPDLYPAQVVQPEEGELLWLVDQGAAGLLSRP